MKLPKFHLQFPVFQIVENEAIGLIDFSNGPKERIAHIGDFGMSVDASMRGLGIGTILLQSLIDWAQSLCGYSIHVKIFPAIF